MANLPKTPHTKPQEPSHPLMTALHIATYPVAAAAAYWVAKTEIRKALYKNFVTSGAFKDLQPGHRKEIAGILDKALAGEAVNGPEMAKKLHDEYRVVIKDRF